VATFRRQSSYSLLREFEIQQHINAVVIHVYRDRLLCDDTNLREKGGVNGKCGTGLRKSMMSLTYSRYRLAKAELNGTSLQVQGFRLTQHWFEYFIQ
jgi:hypothetical protein